MVNCFLATLASSLQQSGTETEVFLSNITTLTGETITTANFSTWGRGILTVDPLVSTSIEFISFTTVDATNIGVTGISRGLSALNNTVVAANKKYHSVGSQVIIAFGIHNVLDIKTYIDNTIIGLAGNASLTNAGVAKLDKGMGTQPRAQGTNVSQQTSPDLTLNVLPFAIASVDQDVSYAGGNSGSFTAPAANPRIDALVYSTTASALVTRTGTESASPTRAAILNGDIVLCTVYNRVGQTSIKEQDDGVNGYILKWYPLAVYNANVLPAGATIEWPTYTAPSGFYNRDGSAKNRTTDAALFAALCPSKTATMTIASPCVITATAHGYVIGDKVHFTTTGGFPTGIAANTDYWIISAGFTANAFEVALAPSGVAVNTSGSQSGVHTVYQSNYGKGDGSTTFNLPNDGGRMKICIGQATTTLGVDAANVSTGSDTFTVPDNEFPYQGQPITLTTSGGLPAGLALATTYYVIRASTTTIKFAATQANANAVTPTAIDITTQGTGVHTLNYTGSSRTVLGRFIGEDTHGLATTELGNHYHAVGGIGGTVASSAPFNGSTSSGGGFNVNSSTQGGDAQHNILSSSMTVNYVIKR